MSFLRHGEIYPCDEGTISRPCPRSSPWMSLQLVIPGRLLSSRARFRFTSRSYTANHQPCPTMLHQRTAQCRLTDCLSRGVQSILHMRCLEPGIYTAQSPSLWRDGRWCCCGDVQWKLASKKEAKVPERIGVGYHLELCVGQVEEHPPTAPQHGLPSSLLRELVCEPKAGSDIPILGLVLRCSKGAYPICERSSKLDTAGRLGPEVVFGTKSTSQRSPYVRVTRLLTRQVS